MLLSKGRMSDYKGAALMMDTLPKSKVMPGDRGHDADWFREAKARGITPCILSKANRRVPIPHDRILYRQRHRIENMLRTGAASTPATIAAPTPSCPQSVSPPPSSSGCGQ